MPEDSGLTGRRGGAYDFGVRSYSSAGGERHEKIAEGWAGTNGHHAPAERSDERVRPQPGVDRGARRSLFLRHVFRGCARAAGASSRPVSRLLVAGPGGPHPAGAEREDRHPRGGDRLFLHPYSRRSGRRARRLHRSHAGGLPVIPHRPGRGLRGGSLEEAGAGPGRVRPDRSLRARPEQAGAPLRRPPSRPRGPDHEDRGRGRPAEGRRL